MNRRYLFFSFLAFVSGILLAIVSDFNILFALIPLFIGIIFVLIKKTRLLSVVCFICAIGLFYTGCFFFEPNSAYTDVTIKGKATSFTTYYNDYLITLEDCAVSSSEEIKINKVLVYCESDGLPYGLTEGNTIECYGDVLPVTYAKHANPGSTSPRLYSQIEGIFYSVNTKKVSVLDNSTDLNYQFSILRNEIRRRIFTSASTSNSAAVLYSLITADRRFIPDEILADFTSTGTSHLLAVSGLHISILVSFIAFFMKKLRLSEVVSLILLGAFLVLYALFTGLSPSVLRASIMAFAFSFVLVFSSRYDGVNILSLAGLLILVCNPFILFDVSFQLSFLACFGIFVFIKYQIFTKYKLLNAIFNSALITVGATVFTLPLQLYYFGSLPIFSVISNLIIVPLVSLGLMLGFIFLLLSFLFKPLGVLIKIPCFIIDTALYLLKGLSKLPIISFKAFNVLFALFVLAVFILLTRFFRFKKRKLIAVLLIICVLFVLIGNVYSTNTIRVYVPPSDKTLCAHIEGKSVYIFGLRGIENYLKRNAPAIDYLFLLNEDDIEALDNLDESIKINRVYLHPDLDFSEPAIKIKARKLNEPLQTKDGVISFAGSGFTFINGESSVFIGENSLYRKYTLAITCDPLVRGKTVVSKGVENNNCRKYYDIKSNGYTYFVFRRHNESF